MPPRVLPHWSLASWPFANWKRGPLRGAGPPAPPCPLVAGLAVFCAPWWRAAPSTDWYAPGLIGAASVIVRGPSPDTIWYPVQWSTWAAPATSPSRRLGARGGGAG